MDNHVVPIWLPGFLELANEEHKDCYFAMCKEHGAIDQKDMRKGQKNHYCVDCKTGPLCGTGVKVDHGGHKVLQVRRESYKDVVNVSDISTMFNIDHIQRFFINFKDVVFLPSRPQAKPAKSSPSYCDVCERSLATKTARFCSLSCKVKAIAGHPRGNSPPVPTKQTARPSLKKEKDAKKKRAMEEEKDGEKDAHSLDVWEDREKEAASGFLLFVSAMREYARSAPVPKKKRSRPSPKKAFAPATPTVFPEVLSRSTEKLDITKEMPNSALLSHPAHDTNDVSSGHESSSSQEPAGSSTSQDPPLETKCLTGPIKAFAPATPTVFPEVLSRLMDLLDITKESPNSALLSHPVHDTNDVSSGHGSSSSQEPAGSSPSQDPPLETKCLTGPTNLVGLAV